MELRLFNRGKDIRFVRPHRIALFEWLRVMRHNLYCELTLMLDKLRTRLNDYRVYWKRLSVQNELFPTEGSVGVGIREWGKKVRETVSGRRAALFTKTIWTQLRDRGVKQTFWPLLFVLGLIVGFWIKTWAEDRITIGYEDYKLEASETLYDLNALEVKFVAEQERPTASDKKVYPACIH